jgi:streptogramin lyase
MWSDIYPLLGCKIQRSGSSGSYTYSVASDWANRPVNFVNWGDAARFCNWLTNSQPTGSQNLSTTEDGSYYLNGAISDTELLSVTRKANARYVIPSEDEWYKAAYYKGGGINAGYWDYPTGTDSVPSNDLTNPDPGNNANFRTDSDDWTIGNPYYRTEVGAFENSESPYGTFDQGGNVWEWNEAVLYDLYRGLRGAAFGDIGGIGCHAGIRYKYFPTLEDSSVGFRVASVTEPVCIARDYEFVTQWGDVGIDDGKFAHPMSIEIDESGYVYVADYDNNRIQKFTCNGIYVAQWGQTGMGNGQFNHPWGIAIDSSGNVYVTDHDNNRVQKFDSIGTYLMQWGQFGSSDGQFNRPQGIDTDSSGNVYVIDYYNNRIQKFDSNGNYLTKWGQQGDGKGQFNVPQDIAIDSLDYVYVTEGDPGNNRIQKCNSDGDYITQWGGLGSDEGKFNNPIGIAIDSLGYVYVAEHDNHRIQKFTNDGIYITKWGSFGNDEGQFKEPHGIALDNSGQVYTTEQINNRVQKFSPICEPTNIAPIADAGDDQVVGTGPDGEAEVVLDCSDSNDPDGDELTYCWRWTDGEDCDANGANPTIVLPCGTYTIELIVNDGTADSQPDYVDITVQDGTPPVISCPNNVTLECPADASPSATGQATGSDTCGSVTITNSDVWVPACGNTGTLTRIWTATDECGNSASCVQTITVVDTTAPVISNLDADYLLAAVGQTVTFSADVNDECDSSVDIVWNFGDGTAPSSNPSHIYGQPGIYTVTVTAADDCGNQATDSIIIVVYDPSAGFTTGGGWFVPDIDSFVDSVGVTDTVSKANFGFIVKYKKGTASPDGNLEFQYKAGEINLRSTDMEWLVVQSATKVRFKGRATINGQGLYTFKVTAEDNGEPGTGDWFKIEIWLGPDVDTENAPPTPKHKAQGYLGGGNIQIHQK